MGWMRISDGKKPVIYTGVWRRNIFESCHLESKKKMILDNINPLKSKLVKIILKYSVRTAKKTQHFTITKISSLMLFKEIIAVYSENHTKPVNTK
jgi:hypothetical protein